MVSLFVQRLISARRLQIPTKAFVKNSFRLYAAMSFGQRWILSVVNLHVQISWQAQRFVNLQVQISWQAQHFVTSMCRFRGRHSFVNLHAQISWQDFVAGAALCEPPCADFVAGAALCEPPCADFMAGTALCERRGADFVHVQISGQAQHLRSWKMRTGDFVVRGAICGAGS